MANLQLLFLSQQLYPLLARNIVKFQKLHFMKCSIKIDVIINCINSKLRQFTITNHSNTGSMPLAFMHMIHQCVSVKCVQPYIYLILCQQIHYFPMETWKLFKNNIIYSYSVGQYVDLVMCLQRTCICIFSV